MPITIASAKPIIAMKTTIQIKTTMMAISNFILRPQPGQKSANFET